MSRAAAPARPADPPAADRGAAPGLVEGQLAMLTRLAEIGMAIAEAAGARAVAEPGAEPGAGGPDPALAFSRAARAVRLTIALQSRLVADQAAAGAAAAKARAAEAAQRRHRIHTRVETRVEAETECADEAERLSEAVWEQLTETEDDDILALPLPEAVARICHALGLAPEAWVSPFAEAAADPLQPVGRPDPFEPPDPPEPPWPARAAGAASSPRFDPRAGPLAGGRVLDARAGAEQNTASSQACGSQ